jgi:hypothetical protein
VYYAVASADFQRLPKAGFPRLHPISRGSPAAGVGVGSTFTATAFGDLDCDGVFSTFVRIGSVRAGNEIRGSAGLYQQNELE